MALASAAPDPVFAVIEEHRAAYLAWAAAVKVDDGKRARSGLVTHGRLTSGDGAGLGIVLGRV
jgi:hypothetical protein